MGRAEGVRPGGNEHPRTPFACRHILRHHGQPSSAQHQCARAAAESEVSGSTRTRWRAKNVSENCKQMESTHDKKASSPRPSPPEEERERIFQTRSKSVSEKS